MESKSEVERLEKKTDVQQVRHRLHLAGVAAGMRVLDVGAGSGAISRVISELVTPVGEVVALEASPERAAYIAERAARDSIDNLRVVRGDLYQPPLEPESFDLVWCQFVFEYLTDPQRATQVLLDLVRPGGKLVIADLDGYAMYHYPLPQQVAEGLTALSRYLLPYFDAFCGRKLFHWFRKAGLSMIQVHMLPYHFYPGAAPAGDLDHWRFKLETIRPAAAPALGGPEAYDRWISAFLEMLQDPDRFTYSVLLIVEGIKPARDRS
jgi:SAM-dependent methyltransferase